MKRTVSHQGTRRGGRLGDAVEFAEALDHAGGVGADRVHGLDDSDEDEDAEDDEDDKNEHGSRFHGSPFLQNRGLIWRPESIYAGKIKTGP